MLLSVSLIALTLMPTVASAASAEFRRGQLSGVGATLRSQRVNAALGFGALGVGLGVAGGVLSSNATTQSQKDTGHLALGVGIGMGLGSLLLVFLRNPYERSADEFLRLSANEDAAAVERRFQALVADERRERRILSLLNLGVSGALIAWGFASSSSTKELLVGIGGAGLLTSATMLLWSPPAPYESLDRLHAAVDESAPQLQFGFAPMPGGAAIATGLRF